MKQSEISKLTVAELQDKLGEYKKTYAELKLQHAISSIEKPIQLRTLRRTIARLYSELTKRELQ